MERAKLPPLKFAHGDGSTRVFHAHRHAASIGALAARLAESAAPGSPVGLLYRTGPALVAAWLASLAAGLEPLILQYPTKKQSRPYWLQSVAHTRALLGMDLIVAEDPSVARDIGGTIVVSRVTEEDAQDHWSDIGLPEDFAILQLSSGTTGFRKAVRFEAAKLRRHVADFNAALGLTPDDVIASWLPLYHDLGYIACFVMPMMIGVGTVTIDAMDWVSRPEILFDVVERERATICYMPNFGFEIMARLKRASPPCMRRWVWSAEPVSADTVRHFAAATGSAAETLYALYGMAENVLTITFGPIGITAENRVARASCGAPIPGVELRIIDDEIWVRSPTMLDAYVGGDTLAGADGFYPTGDLGTLTDGKLIVHGRKRDILVQAGRKIMLTDVDLAAQALAPEVRGRAVAISVPDAALGTEAALVLLEAPRFYARRDAPQLAAELRQTTELELVTAEFVPPLFLTKTSSGKYNRRLTGAHWQARRNRPVPAAAEGTRLADGLRRSFPGADWSSPVGESLDSLSLTVLAVELADAGIALDRSRSLAELAAHDMQPVSPAASPATLRIVSLADRFSLQAPDETAIAALEAALGVPVTYEHVCLPPSPIVLSDLVFSDYFAARLEDAPMDAVEAALDRLRGASVIITDDMSELFYLYESTYPVLSHRLERAPAADLISLRWQAYVRQHHRLPIEPVAGIDLPLSASTPTLDALSDYLRVPFFRMATVAELAAFTEGWEHRDFERVAPRTRADRFWAAFTAWAMADRARLALAPRRAGPAVLAVDLAHFCASAINPDAIDALVARYASFALFGQDASLPALRAAIDAAGKPWTQRPSFAAEALAAEPVAEECLVACGAFGPIATTKPFVALQHIGQMFRTLNLDPLDSPLPPLNKPIASGTSWYREFELQPMRDYALWSAARQRYAA